MACLVDDAHAAPAEHAQDLVAFDLGCGRLRTAPESGGDNVSVPRARKGLSVICFGWLFAGSAPQLHFQRQQFRQQP